MERQVGISIQDVYHLAQATGLELDDARAKIIAERLGGVLDDLARIPNEAIEGMQPLTIFGAESGDKGG